VRVLLVPYPATWGLQGGHRTQALQTQEALARAGVACEIVEPREAVAAAADVVHFFGSPGPLLALGRPIAPLVVTPVHFPARVVLGWLPERPGRVPAARARARHTALCVRYPRRRRGIRDEFAAAVAAYGEADLLVVNSLAEGELLRADARGPLPPVRVAYSGVAKPFFHGSPEEGRRLLELGDEPFALCVGRVEPRKNQLALALALRELPHRLVLVGAVHPANEGYLAACRRARPDLLHVPHLDPSLLPHVYAAAAVHVLPSWYETTGLATLEALAAGTPAVAGRGPCVEEYFRECAALHDPGDLRGLRAALHRALATPRGTGLDAARRLSWDRTAAELLAAYETVAAGREAA